MLTTLLWGGRIDDVSRRVLMGALRAAMDEACLARLPAFAAVARDLLSSSKGRTAARLRPRVTLTDSAEIDRLMGDTRSALHGLFAALGAYLEHALQALEPHVSRDAVRAFILETRGEVDELAACHTAGDVYLESLTVTEAGDKTVSLEVEGALGCGAKRAHCPCLRRARLSCAAPAQGGTGCLCERLCIESGIDKKPRPHPDPGSFHGVSFREKEPDPILIRPSFDRPSWALGRDFVAATQPTGIRWQVLATGNQLAPHRAPGSRPFWAETICWSCHVTATKPTGARWQVVVTVNRFAPQRAPGSRPSWAETILLVVPRHGRQAYGSTVAGCRHREPIRPSTGTRE